MKTKLFSVAFAACALLAGASFAQNGPNPKAGGPASPMSPGGTAFGASQLYAVINPDGSTLRGAGNISSTKLSTGTYDVRFRRPIHVCGWNGTIGQGGFSGSVGASHISVSGRNGTITGVFVQTFDSSNVLTDLPFTLLVVCG